MKEVTYLRRELERYHPFEKMVGKDIRMTRVFDLIATIAPSDAAVLIQGESGTGKELVARAIHNLGPRKKEPFVVVSCAAIPPTMMESELFGHNRGAFTGAIHTNPGKLEMAHRGTVFLSASIRSSGEFLSRRPSGPLKGNISRRSWRAWGGTKQRPQKFSGSIGTRFQPSSEINVFPPCAQRPLFPIL